METEQLSPEQQSPVKTSGAFLAGVLVIVAAVALYLFYMIYSGIHARVNAASVLERETLERAVPTVFVVHPSAQTRAEEIVLPANVEAFVATPIYARTSGYLKQWYFDIGARVKAGQLLAEIEAPEVDRQLDQARADLATAQANLQLAQTTAERYQSLLRTESVSKQEVEDRVGSLQARKATVESAMYNVKRLEELQRFEKIYAPYDGVITARNANIGELINAGANAPGRQLFDLASVNRLRVYVNVPQAYSRSAKPGTTAELTVAEFPGRRFHGTIARTANAIDPVARTLLTEVDVNNSTGELLPGVFTSVHFDLTSKATVVTLPVNTLLFRSEGLRAAVVEDGKAKLVPITVGRDFGTEVEVLTGVTTADSVIQNPSDSLATGMAVHVGKSGNADGSGK